jgi:hypothetical protein
MATHLPMLLRLPMQSDNSFSMIRAAGSRQASLLFRNGSQSEFSNDRLRTAGCFQNSCGTDAISDQSILRWRFAICELVYSHSKRFLAGMSLLAPLRLAGVSWETPLTGIDWKWLIALNRGE